MDLYEVVYQRYLQMPEDFKLAIPGYGVLTKQQILEHLRKRDEIAKLIVELEKRYLEFLIRG